MSEHNKYQSLPLTHDLIPRGSLISFGPKFESVMS